jgi:hypothetical protein
MILSSWAPFYLSCVYALAAAGIAAETDLDLTKNAVMVRQFSFEKT